VPDFPLSGAEVLVSRRTNALPGAPTVVGALDKLGRLG